MLTPGGPLLDENLMATVMGSIPKSHKLWIAALKIGHPGNFLVPEEGCEWPLLNYPDKPALETRVFVLPGLPLDFSEHADALGRDQFKALRASNFVVLQHFDQNSERQDLPWAQNACYYLPLFLRMLGHCFEGEGFDATGQFDEPSQRWTVNKPTRGRRTHGSWKKDSGGVQPLPMTRGMIDKAYDIWRSYSEVVRPHNGGKYRRAIWAVHAYENGVGVRRMEEHIHQSARIIEAFTPDKPSGASEVAKYARTFFDPGVLVEAVDTNSPGAVRKIDLVEFLYKLRSKIEHVSRIETVVPAFDEIKPGDSLDRYCALADLMAANLIEKVYLNPTVLKVYETDDSTNHFFDDQQTNQLQRDLIWGAKFDVEAEYKRRNSLPP